MDFIRNFPFFSIMLAMLAAVITSVLRQKAARILTFFVNVCCIFSSLAVLFYTLGTGESFVYMMGHFPAPWGNELRAGPLEALLSAVFSGVMLFSLLGGGQHIRLDIEESKRSLYYTMMDLLQGALLALLYTNDLFTAYVFIEIVTIASCGILMIRQIGRTTLAAVRYMIMSLLGSGLFLIGLVLLYDITGHLLMENMHQSIIDLVSAGGSLIPLTVAVGLVTAGMCIKSGLFPFHFWMPDTYGYSTPASSAVLSGLISKIYILNLVKIFYRVIGIDVISKTKLGNVLFLFGLAAMIFGSIAAIMENDIRRMTALSSAAQIGYIFAGIGLGTTVGLLASIFHIITHAITKPLLFLSASGLSDSSASSKFSDLQHSGFRNPIAGLGFTIGSFSMVGLPMFAGFVSKLLFAEASVLNPYKMLPMLIVLAISTVLNAVYFLRTVIRIYRPAEDSFATEVHLTAGKQRGLTCAVCVFSLCNILLGLCSTPITNMITQGLKLLP